MAGGTAPALATCPASVTAPGFRICIPDSQVGGGSVTLPESNNSITIPCMPPQRADAPDITINHPDDSCDSQCGCSFTTVPASSSRICTTRNPSPYDILGCCVQYTTYNESSYERVVARSPDC